MEISHLTRGYKRMKSNYSQLVQSKYFNSSFNSAIFDGPLRLYFAQSQESAALKIYFCFQQKYPELFEKAKVSYRQTQAHLILLIYPDRSAFTASFSKSTESIEFDYLENDTLVGICNWPDEKLMLLVDKLSALMLELLDVNFHDARAAQVATI